MFILMHNYINSDQQNICVRIGDIYLKRPSALKAAKKFAKTFNLTFKYQKKSFQPLPGTEGLVYVKTSCTDIDCGWEHPKPESITIHTL